MADYIIGGSGGLQEWNHGEDGEGVNKMVMVLDPKLILDENPLRSNLNYHARTEGS